MKKTLYILLFPLVACLSCTHQEENVEEKADMILNTARILMKDGNYVAAKDSILTMRQRFPKAFNARTAGIIVMDSIELLEAQDSLAFMDSTLQAEQAILEEVQAQRRRGHNTESHMQRIKVAHLKDRFDELGAKVKFYLRKIEVDKAKALEQQRTEN